MTAAAITAACRRRIATHGPRATIVLRFEGDLSKRHSIKLAATRGPKGRVWGFDGDTGTLVEFDAGDVLAHLAES